MLIDKKASTALKYLHDSKAFIEYSNDVNIYKNIGEYNPHKKREILIVFDDMTMNTDKLSDKNINPVATKLFIRGRKLNISLVFITHFNKSHIISNQVLTLGIL